MLHENKALYAAFRAKDARFDGRFFVAVSSTGIYCRPICRARLPRAENCAFYETAAAAEQAGFRPCLLCRPELAPGSAPVDAARSLAHRAARLLEEQCGNGKTLEELARILGCSERHARRAFSAEYQVSPVRYLQTCRLLLAKSLLTDTRLSITDVAMAAGFGSLRRFNDLFKKRYRLAPTALRRQVAASGNEDEVTLTLGYRPPYQWRQMLGFLARRAIPGVERVRDDEYRRTVHVAREGRHARGWVRVRHRPEKNALAVTVHSALLPVLPSVLAGIRHLFDVCCDPAAVEETLAAMNRIRPGLYVPGTRLPGCFDPFEMAVRAVLDRQPTGIPTETLAARFAVACGTPVATGIEGLTHTFPLPGELVALRGSIADLLGPLGISGERARAILTLAKTLAREEGQEVFRARPEQAMQQLAAMRGIGAWAAQYIGLRAMGWPDAFPHPDAGVKTALVPLSEEEILRTAEAWRPWRGYATIALWNFLEKHSP